MPFFRCMFEDTFIDVKAVNENMANDIATTVLIRALESGKRNFICWEIDEKEFEEDK